MFDKKLRAYIQDAKFKRTTLDKGGHLFSDITITAPMTEDMAESLGCDLESIFNGGLNLKTATIDDAQGGLMFEIWRQVGDDSFNSYLMLTNMSQKKYVLSKDEDTGDVFFTVTLKSGPVSEADAIRILHSLNCDSWISLTFAQGDLPLD